MSEAKSKIGINVEIRDNSNGEIRTSVEEATIIDGQPSLYVWEHGNYSCDCNRGLIFADCNDEPDPEFECGDEGYSVRISHGMTGQVIYDEIENQAAN